MGTLTAEDILRATGGKMLSKNADAFAGLSIDSRTIQEGELFSGGLWWKLVDRYRLGSS